MSLESLDLLLDIFSYLLNHFAFAFVFFILNFLFSIYSRRHLFLGGLLLAYFEV